MKSQSDKIRGTEPDLTHVARNRVHNICYHDSTSAFKLLYGIREYENYESEASKLNKKIIL